MIPLPKSGIWNAATNGDKFGDIVRTKNISLARDGYLDLARKALALYTHDEDSGFGTPLVLLADNRYLYVITTDHFFVIDTTSTVFSILEASATNQPTFGLHSDAVIFDGAVVASGDTTVSAIAFSQGQTWPSPKKITGLTDNTPHPLCNVEHLHQLAVGNGNTVKTYDTSFSNQATLTLPAEYVVTCIRWRHNILYIGTRHIYGGDAKLFIWNGSGSAAQDGYTVPGADWIYSLSEYLSSVALVVSTGELLRFNGGGFDTLANFPVYHTPYSWTSNAASSSLVGKVASRGMEAIGKRLFINIDGSVNNAEGVGIGSYLPSQPSGVWCFDPDKGLNHVASPTYLAKLQLIPSSVASSYLKFSTPHQAQTGDPVLCAAIDGLTGLTSGNIYYAIVDADASTTTCKLALSPADAYDGRSIAIGGTPGTDKFVFDRHESVGATSVSAVGALCALKRARFNLFLGSDIIFGASPYDETLTGKGVLMSLSMGRNRGHFITSKLAAGGILDTMQRVWALFAPLRLDTDQIVLKYRTASKYGLPAPLAISGSATWTSSTTFTIDPTLKDVKSIEIGDEIEVVKGAAAGYTAHITNIDNTSSPYTFTIDEAMPVSSGSFDFIADNWIKQKTFDTDLETNARGFANVKIDKDARWIEFKIELRGRDISIDALALINALKQPA